MASLLYIGSEPLELERAWKLQAFFSQPSWNAGPSTTINTGFVDLARDDYTDTQSLNSAVDTMPIEVAWSELSWRGRFRR